MKKLHFLLPVLFLAFAITFNSCEEDEKFDIIGTWNIDKIEWAVYLGDQELESETEENTGTITFNKDGTGTVIEDGESFAFEWELSDDVLTMSGLDTENGISEFEFKLTTKTPSKIVGEHTEKDEYEGLEVTIKFIITLSKI